MDLFMRFSVTVTLLVGLVAGLAYSCPSLLDDMGLDFASLPAAVQTHNREMKRTERLSQELDELQQRAKNKDDVLQDLIAGRIQLSEAGARIAALDDMSQTRSAMDALGIPGHTEDERLCRLVILWTQMLLSDSPEEANQVQKRLESQLAAHFRS